jgi:hypothetical protein
MSTRILVRRRSVRDWERECEFPSRVSRYFESVAPVSLKFRSRMKERRGWEPSRFRRLRSMPRAMKYERLRRM